MSYYTTGRIEGGNIHRLLDNNLLHFYRSKNDCHLGLPDFLYFKILRLDPIQFYNVTGFEQEAYELQLEIEEFERYEKQITPELKKEVDDFLEYFHEKYDDCSSPVMVKSGLGDFYEPIVEKFNAKLISQEIFTFVKNKSMISRRKEICKRLSV